MEPTLVCTVVSLVPFPIREVKPGLIPGTFEIPAAQNETPTCITVDKAMHYVYLDETRGSLQVRDSPDEVARSIVDDFVNSQLCISEDCRPGLFYLVGNYTPVEVKAKFKDRLEDEIRIQRNWLQAIARMADDDWNKYHQHNVVSDFQRIAAKLLSWRPEDHPWMSNRTVAESNRCPSCMTLTDKGVVVCPNCKAILDPEKYKTLQFAK